MDDLKAEISYNPNFGKSFQDRYKVEIYDRDLKICRPTDNPPKSGGIRQQIFQFSASSQRNLLHTCRNSGHYIRSQFVLTYRDSWPTDGKDVKRHLNTFCKRIKRHFGSNVRYIWCLEFQKREAPHIHFFSDIPVQSNLSDRSTNGQVLARMWVDVISAGDVCFTFHSHAKNHVVWNMRSGAYLAKEYLAKAEQKHVPESFHNVGRFWGASRNMKPRCTVILPDLQSTDSFQIIRKAVRVVSKHAEKKFRDIARFCRDRRLSTGQQISTRPIRGKKIRSFRRSVTLHLLAGCFFQALHSFGVLQSITFI